jgi:hypothetical protein
MRQDQTQIVIRERSLIDILDLALRVGVTYCIPLMLSLLTAVLPLALLNWWLLRWMVMDSPDELAIWRFVSAMTCLIVIQAPLASLFLTTFIGQAVFMARPRPPEVFSAAWKASWRIIWCHLIRRGIGLSWGLAYNIPRLDEYSGQEFWILMLAFYSLAIRAFRPYLNEIILLERSPLRSPERRKTVKGRNHSLHSPNSGDLFGRWMGGACIAIPLTISVVMSIWFCFGMLLFDWSWGPVMMHVCLPAAIWLVTGYFAVVRFLSYLDLRIRREGWEVNLVMAGAADQVAGERGVATR